MGNVQSTAGGPLRSTLRLLVGIHVFFLLRKMFLSYRCRRCDGVKSRQTQCVFNPCWRPSRDVEWMGCRVTYALSRASQSAVKALMPRSVCSEAKSLHKVW